jgi:hypothetical protein
MRYMFPTSVCRARPLSTYPHMYRSQETGSYSNHARDMLEGRKSSHKCMPRVTSLEHYRRHRFLQMLWREPGLDIFFALLLTPAQWQLHEYYQPDEDLDELEFSQQRGSIDRRHPTLCHVAGKHFKLIESAFIAASREFGANEAQMNRAVMGSMVNLRSRGKARISPSSTQIAFIANPLNAQKMACIYLRLAAHEQDKRPTG